MLRRSIRRVQPPRPPQVVERYRVNDFQQYEVEIRPLIVRYFNTLQTVYPTSSSVTLINSSARPKRVVDEVHAKRLMHEVFQQASTLHTEIMGVAIPPAGERRYIQSVTRSVSVPLDRDMAEIPGILEMHVRLRQEREESERRQLEEEQEQEFLRREEEAARNRVEILEREVPESYKELEGVVGEATAAKINSWLTMQYEGHILRTSEIETKQILSEIFQPFGRGEVKTALEVNMTGRLYKNHSQQDQVQLSSQLNSNFELIIFQEDDELQEEVSEANALLLFTGLYYALVPEIIGMLLLFRTDEKKAAEDYYSPLQGMNLDPKLYYIYDSSDPEKYNTMIKSGSSMTVRKYLERNKEIALSNASFGAKYRRLGLGIVRLFRIAYLALNKEMIKRSKEWASWEQYTVFDEEGNEGLPVRNINLNMVIPYIRESGLEMNFPWYEATIGDLLETFSLFQIPLEGNRKLQWEFYGKKNEQVNEYQFFELEGGCVDKLREDLLENGYNCLPEGEIGIEELKDYGRSNSVTVKFIGAERYFYASVHTIVVTPTHVELIKTTGEMPRGTGLVAVYKPQESFERKTKVIARDRKPSNEWKLGSELPYDDELQPGIEKELRTYCIVVDIEALAVEEQRQIPYMINAVGYAGDNSRIFYRSWTNKGIYRYEGLFEESKLYSDNEWEDEYCIYAFVEWLSIISKDYDKDNPLYIWGFNSMGYELTYLLLPLTQKFGEVELLGHPSQCKAFKVCGGRLIFCDILKILPIKSLFDYGREFNLKVKKLDFGIALVKTWEEVEEKQDEIRRYCYVDCASTLLLVHKTQATIIQLCRSLDIPHDIVTIARKITASSLGWFVYVQGFLKQSISNSLSSAGKNTFVNNEPFEVYGYQRGSYTGGVVQVYKYVAEERLYVVDVNSMYPAMMCKSLPWFYVGHFTTFVEKTLNELQSDNYLYEVSSYELPATFIGSLVALKPEGEMKNRYMNSYYGQRPLYVRGAMVKRLLYHKASVVMKSVYKYVDNGNFTLRTFSEVIYNERLKATNKSMKELTKLMMNSVTGRCAMNEQREYQARNTPSQDLYIFYDEDLFIQNGEFKLPPSGRMVRITAAITDYSKVYLDELHEKAGYGNVMYSDTDSLIVNEAGYIKLGRPGKTATVLGEFKTEVKEDMAYSYFSAGYFKNRKDYILKYTSKTGEVKYIHKSKGIPKKYIDKQYTEQVIESFKTIQKDLVGCESDVTFTVGNKIAMKVWRRHPFEGTTIRQMFKKTTVIVDRFFETIGSVGLPRNDKYILTGNDEEE